MSLADSLRRLRAQPLINHRGVAPEECIVDKDDLAELLRQFDCVVFELHALKEAKGAE